MQITPLDIQQHRFRLKFRGFDVQQVDTFLEDVSNAFESLLREKQQCEDEIRRQKNENKGFREREETFKRAMLHSQKVMEQMKANARKSAELIVADAEVRAEKLLNRAHNRLSQLHEDIAERKRQRRQIEIQIQSVIEAHAKLLEIGKEEMKVKDDEDDKLKLLKPSQ